MIGNDCFDIYIFFLQLYESDCMVSVLKLQPFVNIITSGGDLTISQLILITGLHQMCFRFNLWRLWNKDVTRHSRKG